MIKDEDIVILPGFSTNAASLLRGLLNRNPARRLNVDQIKNHPFFENINWDQLLEKRVTPPFVPNVSSETDISLIDTDFTNEVPQETPADSSNLKIE